MVVGNHQCNAANLNQSKPQFLLELSLAQFSPSLYKQPLIYQSCTLDKSFRALMSHLTKFFLD